MGSGDYRILHVDVENYPCIGYAWESRSKYPNSQNLISVEQMWNMCSFAYKWEGDKGKPLCVALPDFKKAYRSDPFDDTRLLLRMAELLDEADMVVGHNVDQFDIRKANTRLIKQGAAPPSPYKTFDTLKEARKHFYFPSNKLDDLAQFLECPMGGKVEHEGFGLWLKCMNGDAAAWSRMRKYNIKDVAITQWLYHRLRPWSKTHPNITLNGEEENLCPACGGRKSNDAAGVNLKTYKVERYRCLKADCHKWSQGKRVKLDIRVLSS